MTAQAPHRPGRRQALHQLGAQGAVLFGLPGMAAVSTLTACSVIDTHPGESPVYYQIQDLRPRGSAPRGAGAGVLLLGGVSAAALHDSDRMVYTRDGLAYAYYQFAHWSERPGKRLAVLAEHRLAASGRYAAVVPSVAGVRGDWMLQLRLDDLTHEDRRLAPQAPEGRVVVRVSATLVDWRQRSLLARQSFEAVQPVASADARGAAQATHLATTAVLDALEAWLSEVTPRPNAR